MTQMLASLPLVGRLFGFGAVPTVHLKAVPVHVVETAPEKRPRTVKHLLRANHVNHALVYDHLRCYNPMAHALCAAYLLGAQSDHLHEIYDAISSSGPLEPWISSPAEIALVDWRDFLGDRHYQRAYVDFFEDILAEHKVAYNWKTVVEMFLFRDAEPIVNNLISGLGQPLVHLAYAFEMDSRVLAMEGLAVTCVSYNFLHRYLDDPKYTKPPPSALTADGFSLQKLLARVAADKRFDTIVFSAAPSGGDVAASKPKQAEGGSGSGEATVLTTAFEKNIESLFGSSETEAALLEYWNAWPIAATTTGAPSSAAGSDVTKQFQDVQEVAAALLVATVAPGTHSYSFFLSHVLTASHGARVLLPHLPARYHLSILRQWWLLALAVYVSVGRPTLDPDYVPTDRKGKGWAYVEQQALTSRFGTDAQFIQSIRAIQEASRTWGDIHDRYLNAAVWFVDDFAGWTH